LQRAYLLRSLCKHTKTLEEHTASRGFVQRDRAGRCTAQGSLALRALQRAGDLRYAPERMPRRTRPAAPPVPAGRASHAGRAGAPAPALDFAAWIVWRDAHLIAVDKPAGVLSQGGEGGAGTNLVDLARAHLGREGIGVLHRLDRNVSGLVLLALEPEAARGLSAALARGEVLREYVAVVRGAPAHEAWTIDAPLVKDPATNLVRVGEGPASKPARTEVRVVARFRAPLGACAVLEVRPITGRSHQIRAHLAHAGLPILGDPKYGAPARGVRRPLLHARRMRFVHPRSGETIELVAPPPWRDDELRALRRS
jgi:RluA family pseudouridine synthase